jgi:beta-lactamase superfamily II metal-dependent hydrolase
MKKNEDSGVVRKKLEDYSYLLTENIGKGYSSQVFRGRNDLTGKAVVMKIEAWRSR